METTPTPSGLLFCPRSWARLNALSKTSPQPLAGFPFEWSPAASEPSFLFLIFFLFSHPTFRYDITLELWNTRARKLVSQKTIETKASWFRDYRKYLKKKFLVFSLVEIEKMRLKAATFTGNFMQPFVYIYRCKPKCYWYFFLFF